MVARSQQIKLVLYNTLYLVSGVMVVMCSLAGNIEFTVVAALAMLIWMFEILKLEMKCQNTCT